MCELIRMHLLMCGIAKKISSFNTHDIALLLVKFGEKLKVVFSQF